MLPPHPPLQGAGDFISLSAIVVYHSSKKPEEEINERIEQHDASETIYYSRPGPWENSCF
jgi:hypothetical protein